MLGDGKGVTRQEVGAFGVGLGVTIASALITSLVNPIPFPFNFLISFALGGTAAFGTLKVLDPRTWQDVIEEKTNVEYQLKLQEIKQIAMRTNAASHNSCLGTESSERLWGIARMVDMILERYQDRRRDFVGASSTLLILQKFDEVLAHYLKVKCGELFLDEGRIENEIAESETRIIPMFEMALESLGKKLDAGEILDKGISKGTLESMLRSLNLIESLSDQIDSSSPEKGDS